jgi:hypothetical protein
VTALAGTWNFPRAFRFGTGRIKELGAVCRDLGTTRPLIVTDPGIAATGMIEAARKRLADEGITAAVFTGIHGNPTESNVMAGVATWRAGGHDGVVAWGGGSSLDGGKSIGLLARSNEALWRFEWRPEEAPYEDPVDAPPIISVPTTAGTGAEVDGGAVITDTDARLKRIIAHPEMAPRLIIADPALTLSLPANLTAWTGIDALVHCLEAVFVPAFDPFGDGIGMHGAKLVRDWLPRAVANGADLAARSHMLAAATMGAVAFRQGLGAVHGISHAIGAMLDTHHGLTNAVVLPYVFAFNAPAIEEKSRRLAAYLDLPDVSTRGLLDWMLGLRRGLAIPPTLAGVGVTEGHVEDLIPRALADGNMLTNPVPMAAADVRRVLLSAIRGEDPTLS